MRRRNLLVVGFAASVIVGCALPTGLLAAPLTMTCHELIQGAPDPDGNRFVLNGDTLTNEYSKTAGTGAFLSSSELKMLTPFSSQTRVSTWATHRVVGHKVHRTVYWKNRAGKTVRLFHESYDFDAQTLTGDLSGKGDSCHHSGR